MTIEMFTAEDAKGAEVRRGNQNHEFSSANLCEPLRNSASSAVKAC